MGADSKSRQKQPYIPPTPPTPEQLAELETVREEMLRKWISRSVGRELARLGKSPNGAKGRDWLSERDIQDGEFQFATKPYLAGQKQSQSLTECVCACGLLHSIAYKGELAVKLDNDELVPLSSDDIRYQINTAIEERVAGAGWVLSDEQKKELRVERQEIRRALAKLEAEGRALRTLRDGTPLRNLPLNQRKTLHQGDILIFFFFRPLPPEPHLVGNQCLPKFSNFAAYSPEIKKVFRTLKRLGLEYDPEAVGNDAYLRSKLAQVADAYQKAEAVARKEAQTAFSVDAEGRHIRKIVLKDTSKRTIGRAASEGSSSSSFSEPSEPTAGTTTTSPNLPVEKQNEMPRVAVPDAPSPGQLQSGGEFREGQVPRNEQQRSRGQGDVPAQLVPEVRAALLVADPVVDDEIALDLIARCRQVSADVTGGEIAYFVHAKIPKCKGKPLTYLTAAVVKCMGSALADYRAKLQRDKADEEARSRWAGKPPQATYSKPTTSRLVEEEEPTRPEPSQGRIAFLEAELEYLNRQLKDIPEANVLARRPLTQQIKEYERELAGASERKPAASGGRAQAQKAGQE